MLVTLSDLYSYEFGECVTVGGNPVDHMRGIDYV